jgi:hypothetical protein
LINDTIYGTLSKDTFRLGEPCGRVIDLLDGLDTLAFENSPFGVRVFLNESWMTKMGSDVKDTILNVECIRASHHDDILIGDSGNNSFRALLGNDYIDGLEGYDELIYGTFYCEKNCDGMDLILDLNLGTVWSQNFTKNDRFLNIEKFFLSHANDRSIMSETNTPIVDGRDGFDILDFSFITSPVSVNLSSALGSKLTNGTFQVLWNFLSIEGIVGTDYNDFLFGNDSSETFVISLGDDLLDGG